MALTPRKTYPELEAQTTIEGTDLVATYRAPGPLKGLPASTLLTYITDGVEPLVTDAETARDEAVSAAATAVIAADAAEAQALLAEQYAGEAETARLASGFYPSARSNVPRGIDSVTIVNGGTGYTNGTYDVETTGGSLTVQGEVRLVVSGGIITSATVTGPGLYIGASPVAPTVPLGALGGGASGNVTVALDFIPGSGEYYWTDDATSANLMALYQNVAGVATATSPLVNLTKTLTAAVVPCTVSAPNSRSYPMTPVTGFSVNGVGTSQLFFGIAGATNGEGQLGSIVTATIAGVFSGAATEIVLPNGNSLPAGAIQTSSPFILQPSATRSKYVLVSPAYTVQDTFVQLEWVSGTGNAIVAKLAFAETKLPSNLAGVRFAVKTQGPSVSGGKSLAIRNFANTADVLAATNIYDKSGTTQATQADAWIANQWLEVTRDPATSRLLLVEYPSTALSIATSQDAALAFQLRTVTEPVFAEKVTDRLWSVKVPVIYDDTNPATSRKMNQDYHNILMYDLGRAMSGGTLTSAYAWSINSQKAKIGGVDYEYGMLYSDELGGSTFQGDSPSTYEFAFPVGLHADSSSGYVLYGFGHVQMALTGTPTISMDGGASLLTAEKGTIARGSSFVFSAVYNVYRPPTLTPTRIGQVTIVHTFNANGCTVSHTHKVGRTMSYTSGNLDIAEGTTITGATSGATAVLVVAPAPTTGSYAGSNAAGDWYVKDAVGTFQNGEALQTAGVTRAVMNGTLGAQIGVDNAYAAMLVSTSITQAKPNGYVPITVGYEVAPSDPNYQRPNVTTDGISTWANADRLQFLQPIVDANVIYEMILNGNYPLDPPGDYSLCATSQMFLQDREEGIRKGYANWVSGGKQVYEGTYVGNQTYRFRVGALV